MINVVETGKTPEYADIQPRYYPLPPRDVFIAARQTLEALPRVQLIESNSVQRQLKAEAKTRLFRFVDDMTVSIEANIETDPEGAIVHVRSASRVGKGDFGQNARNIRTFFATLDHILKK